MNVRQEIATLDAMNLRQLREKHREVFGSPPRSGNAAFLRKRIAWQIQAKEVGTVTEELDSLAEGMAQDIEMIRHRAPRRNRRPTEGDVSNATISFSLRPTLDRRVPMPGSVLAREYRGRTVKVLVKHTGFEYEGKEYRSLTAAVKAITGSHWNGFNFFGIA